MTGIKLRVRRDGQYTEVDADELRPDEWPAVVTTERRYGRDGWAVAEQLARWIRTSLAEGP